MALICEQGIVMQRVALGAPVKSCGNRTHKKERIRPCPCNSVSAEFRNVNRKKNSVIVKKILH